MFTEEAMHPASMYKCILFSYDWRVTWTWAELWSNQINLSLSTVEIYALTLKESLEIIWLTSFYLIIYKVEVLLSLLIQSQWAKEQQWKSWVSKFSFIQSLINLSWSSQLHLVCAIWMFGNVVNYFDLERQIIFTFQLLKTTQWFFILIRTWSTDYHILETTFLWILILIPKRDRWKASHRKQHDFNPLETAP